MLMALLAIVLTLILVIGIHELGHALAATWFQIKIKRISIGFGKPLLQWTSASGIEWVWGMWPLGGYVHLYNSRISPVLTEDIPYCFDHKSPGVKIAVLLSGIIANLVVAFAALVLVYSLGMNARLAVIQQVIPDSIAAQAGFLDHDEIIAIGSYQTKSWEDVGMALVMNWGKTNVPVAVKEHHQNKPYFLDLSAIKMDEKRQSLLQHIGWIPDPEGGVILLKANSITEVLQMAGNTFLHMLYFFMMIIKQLVTGTLPFSLLLGPVGLLSISVASLGQGLIVFSYFIAILSLAVGFINLIPIPGLDGGGLVYAVIEKVRGEPISVALEVLLFRLVFIIFCLILVQLLLNDMLHFLH